MKYLCDTCILIDYLRGKEEIKNKLSKDKHISESTGNECNICEIMIYTFGI